MLQKVIAYLENADFFFFILVLLTLSRLLLHPAVKHKYMQMPCASSVVSEVYLSIYLS